MLTVNSVSVKIGAILALKNFTLDIKKGEMISLIGRNGAGKTTLLKSIMGVNKLANGKIKFNDLDLNNSASHEISLETAKGTLACINLQRRI